MSKKALENAAGIAMLQRTVRRDEREADNARFRADKARERARLAVDEAGRLLAEAKAADKRFSDRNRELSRAIAAAKRGAR